MTAHQENVRFITDISLYCVYCIVTEIHESYVI